MSPAGETPCRETSLRLQVDADRSVAARLLEPPEPRLLYVLAHGAGAGMDHRFMEDFARSLVPHGIATLRYQFVYMEEGRRRPDRPALLHRAVRSAIEKARQLHPDTPLLAGGRSMGGRMTSQLLSKETDLPVRGLVFHAFPLHPPRRPAVDRADHLDHVEQPMLFLQGTRDDLADLELLEGVCARLGERATLRIIEGGDHSFRVLKRSGRTAEEVREEIAQTTSDWCRRALGV